jgi:guanylate kinase
MSMPDTAKRGRIVVVSGPSGAGKNTVLRGVFQRCPAPLAASVSATTRPPRAGETDGVDYHFLTPDEFERRRRAGEFIECFQVFDNGYWYGTLRSEAMAALRAGKWVVLNIDVQGGMAVMEQFPDAVTIFLRPGSMEELERRLRGRDTESESSIRSRLQRAKCELDSAGRYGHQVVNDDLERAIEEINAILTHQWENCRDDRRTAGRSHCQQGRRPV